MWIVEFASKAGFFISYVATFFLVLEIVRLVCSDANKREAERLLDVYTQGRESEKKLEENCKLSVDELEHELEAFPVLDDPIHPPETPQRRTHRAVSQRGPTSEKTTESEKEKRKRSQTPTRRLRKRSDTLNSTGSSDSRHSSRSKSLSTNSESRRSSRSHRESSPESVTSKSSSNRRVSPSTRRSKEASLSLHHLLRQKV